MGIEVSAKGRPARLFGQEPSLEEMARVLTELVGKHSVSISAVQGQGALNVRLCTAAMARLWAVKNQWNMGCQTTTAGPGAHAALLELLDAVGGQTGLRWQVEDPTGYAADRDFGRLRAAHMNHLRQIARAMDQVDNTQERPVRFMNWPMTDQAYPVFEQGVVTPMGWFDNGSLAARAWQDVEALALDLFIWPNKEMDSWYWRNRALWNMWNRIFWTRDMSREEGAVMEESCRFLERAARLDEWIPLPRLEYEQLCDLLERPAQPWGNPAMDQPIEIGYRKQDYRHSLDNWSVTVDGNLRARYPARNVLTLARDQRTVKVEALREDQPEMQRRSFSMELGNTLYEGRFEQVGERSVLLGVCHAWDHSASAMVEITWPSVYDDRWARMTLMNIRWNP